LKKRINRGGEKEKREWMHQVGTWVKIAIAVCLVATLFYFRNSLSLDSLQSWFSSLTGSSTSVVASGGEQFKFVADSHNNYLYYRDQLAVVGPEGIKIFSSKEEYSLPLSYQKPVAKASKKYLISYEMGKKELTVVYDHEIKHTITTDGSLITAAVNDSGFILTVTSETNYKGVITVYNSAFEQIYKYSGNETIMDADISPSSDGFQMLSVSTDKGYFSSKLTSFSLSQEEPVGTYEMDNVMAIDVSYQDSSVVNVLSDHDLYSFNTKAEQKGDYNFGGRNLQFYDLSPDRYNVVVLSTNQSGSKSSVKLLDSNGGEKGEYQVDEEVKDIAADGANVYVLTQKKILVINSSGNLTKTLELKDEIRAITPSKDGIYAIAQNWAKDVAVAG
jgi:hypothetical protein